LQCVDGHDLLGLVYSLEERDVGCLSHISGIFSSLFVRGLDALKPSACDEPLMAQAGLTIQNTPLQ
jgi:hypothetical protein